MHKPEGMLCAEPLRNVAHWPRLRTKMLLEGETHLCLSIEDLDRLIESLSLADEDGAW